MKRLACLLLLISFVSAFAQERHHDLILDGVAIFDAGPYFFVEHDHAGPFARADALADALGITVDFHPSADSLVFRSSEHIATLQVTSDIARGVLRQSRVLTVDGHSTERPTPMAIMVDGVTYVPLRPIVDAFFNNASIYWHADIHTIEIQLGLQAAN